MNSEEEARLFELDFHTRKEILNDVSPYSITIPLKHVQRNNAKPETMLYNLTKTINWNNISDNDYAAGATNIHPLKALSERFCDNIIFYYLVPIGDSSNKNKNDYLAKYLSEHTSKIKRILAEHNININKR